MKKTNPKVRVLLLCAALVSSALSLGMLSTASAAPSYRVMATPPYTLAQIQKDQSTKAVPKASALPTAVDNTAQFPPPGNQGSQGSCTAWAVSYAYKTMQENRDHGWGVSSTTTQFSPSFVYNQINGGVDGGSYIHDAMQLLKDKGDTTLADMPYNQADYRTQPNARQLANAYPHRSASYASLTGTISMKDSIVTSGGAVISIPVYNDFDTISASNPIYDVISGPLRGYHAIALIGYDDAKQAFKFINSWSTAWGVGGYGWIAYSLVDNASVGIYGYTMTDLPETNTESLKMTDRVVSGDFNGDGRSDIAAFYDAGNTKTILYVWYANPNGTFTREQKWITGNAYDANRLTGRVVAGDFNGDGKADIAGFYDYGRSQNGSSQTRIHVWLSTGGGFTYVGDYGWWKSASYTASMLTGRVVAGDFNGDGKADIAGFYDYGRSQNGSSQTRIHVWLSTGSNFNDTGDYGWWKSASYTASMLTGRVVAGDFNGDGKADIAGFYDYGIQNGSSQTRIHVWLSTGSNFNDTGDYGWWKSASYTASMLTGRVVAGDFNGDKKTDIAGFYNYGNAQTRAHVWLSTGSKLNDTGDNGWWRT